MKNKLKLAIASLIVQFLLNIISYMYPYLLMSGGGWMSGLRTITSVLGPLSVLGMLPFFFSLYKSQAFNTLMEQDAPSTPVNDPDHDWPKHLLIRVASVIGICLALFVFSLFGGGVSGAYLVAYGIAYTLGIAALFLIGEAIVLFVRKCPYKAGCNIVLLTISLCFLYSMM